MTYTKFGSHIKDPFRHVTKLADEISAAGLKPHELNGFDREILLREAYETEYGLHDHVNTTINPPEFSLIFMNPKENFDEHGGIYNAIRRYLWNDIHKEMGLSLTDFYELPKDITDFIFRQLAEKRERINHQIPLDKL